jgi:hypothetical protein
LPRAEPERDDVDPPGIDSQQPLEILPCGLRIDDDTR